MHKAFKLASFKALDQVQGIFEAVVAVFGNVDRGGDKIIAGAFTKTLADWQQKGRPIPVIYSHEWDNLDALIGQVIEAKETSEGLYIKAQLAMDEPFAARVYKKMANGTLAEFSFAYDVADEVLTRANGDCVNELRQLDLLEVGPCLVGMNPDTRLVGVKKAVPTHATPTTDTAWDGPAMVARLNAADEANFRKCFAWYDATADDANGDGYPDAKAAWKFPHHMVADDGTAGAANLKGCSAGIGVLNGGRGGAAIPDGDRAGVHAHLARHMMDGNMEPPELMPMSQTGKVLAITLTDDIDVVAFKTAWETLSIGLRKEGRRNSGADAGVIQAIHDHAAALGATCADGGKGEGPSADEAGDGKSGGRPSTLAARIAAELIELGTQ